MNPNILAILITVRNANKAVAEVNGVKEALGGATATAQNMASAFKLAASATLVLLGAMKAAGTDEAMRLQLTAITHDASMAMSQMRAVREESERGLFDKEQLFQARKVFDETHSSIKELLPLAEELALRSGKGLDATARVFASLNTGGIARLGAILRQAGLGVDELRGAGLDITKSYQVKSSPGETLRVLREVLGKDSLASALGGSLSAGEKGVMAALADLFRSIGDGLLPFVKPALSFLTQMFKTLTLINDVTYGWLGNIVLAVGALKTISVVLPIMKALIDMEKIAVFWSSLLTILNKPWRTIADGIYLAVEAIKAFASAEKIAAAWTAIMDALSGNWAALAAGAVVAAVVGIAWHFANAGQEDEQERPAERPIRRSDIENQMSRARARAWA